MKDAIIEYSSALEAHMEAVRNEMVANDAKKKSYYRLMRAKDELRAHERELLMETELL